MAAPTPIAAARSVSSTTNATSFTPSNWPTGSGGRLFAYVTSRNSALLTASSTDWRKVGQITSGSTSSTAMWYTDTAATSITINSASTTQYSCEVERMPANTVFYSNASSGSSTNSDPAAVDHLRSRDVLYKAVRGGAGTTVATVAPSGYSNLQSQAGGGANGASISTASKTATSSSDNPGTFTSGNAVWTSITVAYWVGPADPLANWKAAVQSLSSNLKALFLDDSLTAGAWSTGNRMASNAKSASYPNVIAAGFTACKVSLANFCGTGGSPIAGDAVTAYDTRLTRSGGWTSTDDGGGFYTLGSGLHFSNSTGNLIFTPGAAFDRLRVGYETWSGADNGNSVKVNAGSATGLTQNAADSITHIDLNIGSGTSSGTITVVANNSGSAAGISYIDTWLNGVPQVSFINGARYGSTVADMIDRSGYATAGNGILELAPDLLAGLLGSNDTGDLVVYKSQLRQLALLGLKSGEVHFTPCPYVDPVTFALPEADQLAGMQCARDISEELGLSFFPLYSQTGWTSYAAQSSAGYMAADKAHLNGTGYAAFGALLRGVLDPGPIAQALTPSLFTNSATFYTPTVSPAAGSQALTPSLFTNTGSFYSATVAVGAVTLAPALFNNTASFYTPAITVGAVTLAPDLFSNSNAFYDPTVSQGGSGQSLTPSLFANSNSFFTPTITTGAVTLAPSLFTNTAAFYSPAVAQGGATLLPALLVNANAFYAPATTVGAVTLHPGLLTNQNTFYPPAVIQPGGAQALFPSLFANENVFYLASAANQGPPGTYPLSIEGGGTVVFDRFSGDATVVGGTITFSGRVVLGALRGRP